MTTGLAIICPSHQGLHCVGNKDCSASVCSIGEKKCKGRGHGNIDRAVVRWTAGDGRHRRFSGNRRGIVQIRAPLLQKSRQMKVHLLLDGSQTIGRGSGQRLHSQTQIKAAEEMAVNQTPSRSRTHTKCTRVTAGRRSTPLMSQTNAVRGSDASTPAEEIMTPRRCECIDLFSEIVPYEDAWRWQHEIVDAKLAARAAEEKEKEKENEKYEEKEEEGHGYGFSDTIIILQHAPTYTMGAASSDRYLKFDPDDSKFVLHRTERGGEVTYHGPGQLVAYPILDLRKHNKDLHWYLRSLEEVIIRALWKGCGIPAYREQGLTGVWAGGRKLAAIGVRVTRWITYHGLALNVTTDLAPFSQIVPCGISNREVGSVAHYLQEWKDDQKQQLTTDYDKRKKMAMEMETMNPTTTTTMKKKKLLWRPRDEDDVNSSSQRAPRLMCNEINGYGGFDCAVDSSSSSSSSMEDRDSSSASVGQSNHHHHHHRFDYEEDGYNDYGRNDKDQRKKDYEQDYNHEGYHEQEEGNQHDDDDDGDWEEEEEEEGLQRAEMRRRYASGLPDGDLLDMVHRHLLTEFAAVFRLQLTHCPGIYGRK
ncbi:hypothetical protein CBR_g38019 [Chara braunii]|uniref:lipoyl(octanoyl) transferase n=1 Tax=Chara braunii TaxID=69332 RepID=A0A388K055_CHABU|nr:hypothetical protein CBR_g38019 [Chara braunii]|eukprot:GBG63396.1 hypothetical protein CBR_g38019 [Chara braunii]